MKRAFSLRVGRHWRRTIGMMPPSNEETSTILDVGGMNCASCVAHVEKAARSVPGVRKAEVNLARGRAAISFDPSQTDPAKVAEAITASGYPSAPQDAGGSQATAEEARL